MGLLECLLKNKKENSVENKFTWGDPVVITKDAPTHLHPGEFASVCGFYNITSEEGASAFQCDIGDWIYTVEFPDGSDIQIAEPYLEGYGATQ
jgi:hypothetical protein